MSEDYRMFFSVLPPGPDVSERICAQDVNVDQEGEVMRWHKQCQDRHRTFSRDLWAFKIEVDGRRVDGKVG